MRSVGFRAYCNCPAPLALAMCSRTVQEPGWPTRLWQPSPMALPNATSPRCAINSPIWKRAASARTCQKLPTPPSARLSVRRCACFRASLLSPGGKSFGGRMTSQAQAASPLPGGQGLLFLGFPLHPAGRPSDERGAHLFEITIPMLFLQGSRDALAATELIETLVQRLGERATLKLFEDADHSFHVPAKTGRKDAEVRSKVLDELSAWLETIV